LSNSIQSTREYHRRLWLPWRCWALRRAPGWCLPQRPSSWIAAENTGRGCCEQRCWLGPRTDDVEKEIRKGRGGSMKEVRCVKVEEINKEDAHSLRIVLSKSSSAFVFFCARLQSSTLTLTQTPKMQEEKTHTHTSEGPLNSVFFYQCFSVVFVRFCMCVPTHSLVAFGLRGFRRRVGRCFLLRSSTSSTGVGTGADVAIVHLGGSARGARRIRGRKFLQLFRRHL